jgi:hypothetical protein
MVLQIIYCLGFRLQASSNGLANYSYSVVSDTVIDEEMLRNHVFFCARRIEANKNLERASFAAG